jgi:hypothetical protein
MTDTEERLVASRPGLLCHYCQNAPLWLCSHCHSAHVSVRIYTDIFDSGESRYCSNASTGSAPMLFGLLLQT